MQIDWITVVAQAINFLVLVWLLRRFLYRPILDAMATRERRIAERLAQANEREQAAAAREAEYAERLARFERESGERHAEVEREAAEEKAQLLDAARRAAADAESGWREGLAREKREFAATLRESLGAAIGLAASRCVAELADANLHARAIERFVARLASLDEPLRRALAGADRLVLVTASALDDEARAGLERSVREALAGNPVLRFEHDPQLVLGVELRSADTRVAWSAADYLDEAERQIDQRIEAAQAG